MWTGTHPWCCNNKPSSSSQQQWPGKSVVKHKGPGCPHSHWDYLIITPTTHHPRKTLCFTSVVFICMMLFSVSGKLSVAPLAQWAVSRHWDEQHLTQLWPVHCTVHYLALYNTDCTTGKPLKKNILTSVCSMFNLNSNVFMMSLPSVDNWMFILTKREVVVRNWSSILNSHNINSYYRCTLNWSAVRPWQGLCQTIIGGSGAVLWPIRSIDSHVRREAVVLALEFTSSAVACLWCNPGSSDLRRPTSLCEWHF